jgi:ribonuclease P protein component
MNAPLVGKQFPRQCRLLNAADFQFVFQKPRKKANQFFVLFSRKNQTSQPRLGLIISKKSVKLAVNRNIVKRIARDSFRHYRERLNAIDIIFLARKGIDKLTKRELRDYMDAKWNELLAD